MNEQTSADSQATASAEENSGGPGTNASVADMAQSLHAERPTVQAHVIEASRQEQAQIAADVKVDDTGVPFDAAKHTGTKTSKGVWRLKKATGATGTDSTGGGTQSKLGTVGGNADSAKTAPASKEIAARAGGKGAANLFIMAGVGVFGQEWLPRIIIDDKKNVLLDEKLMLETVFGDYFVATGKADLPPGWALAAGLAMYTMPRFAMPATKTRIQRVKDFIVAKFIQFKARKKGVNVKVEPANE